MTDVSFEYSKLNGKIIERCGTQGKFAKLMGLSEKTISLKLNNKIVFKQDEISKALEILCLSNEEIADRFFTPKIQNI